MSKILLINGPNLNLLGSRETHIYGSQTLSEIESALSAEAASKGHALQALQSNHEGALIDAVQHAKQNSTDFIIINPGAYTHTSIALRDAFLATQMPFIEIHISEPKEREAFRHHSYLNDIAISVISGQGTQGYHLALEAAIRYCDTH